MKKIVKKLGLFLTLALVMTACSSSSNPTGPSSSDAVGTWEAPLNFGSMTGTVTLVIGSDNTYTVTVAGDGGSGLTTVEREAGTWISNGSLLNMTPTSCQEIDDSTGNLVTATCDAADSIPISISGNTWTVVAEPGTADEMTFVFTKQ